VITEGGTKPYAVCRGCAGEAGTSLGGAWLKVLSWFVLPIVGLAVILVVLALLFG
jgi:hypothetical protein